MLDIGCFPEYIQYVPRFDSWLYSSVHLVILQIFSFVSFYITVERFEYWPLDYEGELSGTIQRDRFTVGRKCFSLNRAALYLNESFMWFYSIFPGEFQDDSGWFVRKAHITDCIPIPFNSPFSIIFESHPTAYKSVSWSSIIKPVPIPLCLLSILLMWQWFWMQPE
jgi:hypothetical protein